jgi:hypothetical protein
LKRSSLPAAPQPRQAPLPQRLPPPARLRAVSDPLPLPLLVVVALWVQQVL